MSRLQQFTTFYVDGLLCGIDVEAVQEVTPHLDVTRVPLAPAWIAGLTNLRSQIVTVIDLRCRLGLSQRPADCLANNVVIHGGPDKISLLVDEIAEVVGTEPEALEPPPEVLNERMRKNMSGVVKLDDRLLLVLDVEEVVKLDTDDSGAELDEQGRRFLRAEEDLQ